MFANRFQGYIEATMQEAGLKNRLKRLLLWLALLLILLLTALSIYGAFLGADNAKVFFNSLPMSVFWVVFIILLVLGIAFFRRLISSPASFLTHFGCVLVLAGGFWGSQAGVQFRNRFLHTDIIRSGEMVIYQGQTQQTVTTDDEQSKELPFAVKLDDFKIEYYPLGWLNVQTPQGKRFKFPARPGKKYNLGPDFGNIEVVRQFSNFKMLLNNGEKTAIDDPNGKPNPALKLRVISPDKGETTRYAFEKFPGHPAVDNLTFSYRRTIRDFISDVEIIKNGSVVTAKSIEVNKPLHFGGYLFYQQGYDNEAGQYTILGVVNDTGLFVVHLGFFLLCTGLFWNFWLSSGRRRAGDG
jgi:hypothetical protein